jgi:Subtilase family
MYQGCVDFKNAPTDLESFGGTSESAPLIAGGAALIIQAYRGSHGGATPSPALVRQLLTSTATDLHAPSFEEGSGEMNTLAAVQAARAVGNTPSSANGNHLLVGPTQLDIGQTAGTTATRSVKVTNLGATTQIVHAQARQIAKTVDNLTGSVNLTAASPTFVDQFGSARPSETFNFTIKPGTDRLQAFDGWNGPAARVGMALIDPNGNYAAYTRPQGDGNHGEVDVANPVGGQWTAIIFLRDGTFSGQVNWQMLTQDFGSVDSLSPSSQSIAPGRSKTFQVNVKLPSAAGDSSQDLELNSGAGTTIVPVSVRSQVKLNNKGGDFAGTLIGGNGRNGTFQPGQINTFDFNVPAGKPELSVALSFQNNPNTQIFASLIGPNGQTVTAGDNIHVNPANGRAQFTNALQVYAPSPRPGLWRFVVDVFNPAGGQVLSSAYSGRVTFAAPPVTITGLPNNAGKRIAAGKSRTVTVTVKNNGVGIQDLFLDPRTPQRQAFSLLAITPDAGIEFPLPAGTTPPFYLVPTQTNTIDAVAQASEPVTFDFGPEFGDPDLPAISSGNSAAATFATRAATPELWDIAPTTVGPFGDTGAAKGTVSTAMIAHTLGFDTNTSSSTGDIWQQAVDPNAADFTPLTLQPGQKGTMTLTITPSGRSGKVVRGTLYVDVFGLQLDIGGEVVAVPYEYTIK